MKALFTLVVICLFWPCTSHGQFSVVNDSSVQLGLNDFISLVQLYHPVAKQADLRIDFGDAVLLEARGGFDPKITSAYEQKQFKDQEYYQLLTSKMDIPTNFGVSVQGKFELNDGQFLNPEGSVPDNGLYSVGVNVPLGRGLFFDRRRAMLSQARIYQQSNVWERIQILNELYLDAMESYLDWYRTFRVLDIFNAAVTAAQQRRDAVIQAALQGDRPYIDTVEAGIQVQNRQIAFNDALLEFQKAAAFLSTFLWNDEGAPLVLSDNSVPDSLIYAGNAVVDRQLESSLDSFVDLHPKAMLTRLKGDLLDVDQRLARENVKPQLNLGLNYLWGTGNALPTLSDNYAIGVDFSLPLLLRSERGKLQKIKIERRDNEFNLMQQQQLIRASIQQAIQQLNMTNQQLAISQENVTDYSSLLAGERRLFELGESSLFLINSRELGLIDAQVKLLDTTVKIELSRIYTYYAGGILHQIL